MFPLPRLYKRFDMDYQEEIPIPPEIFNYKQLQFIPLSNHQMFEVENDVEANKVRVISLYTPGHTADHVSFILPVCICILSV